MKKHARAALCNALALLLAFMLVPVNCLVWPDVVQAAQGSGASLQASSSTTDAASEEADAVWGQALVLYHAGDAAAELGLAAESEDEDGGMADTAGVAAPLEDAGFAVSQTWDVSAPDSAAGVELSSLDDDAATDDGAGSADDDTTYSALNTEPSAAAADLRVALVCDDALSPDELVAKLEALDFVETAQPNYIASTAAADAGFDDTFYKVWQEQMTSATVTTSAGTYNVGVSTGAAAEADVAATASGTIEENVVAVIDSGVDFKNPDLAAVAWENPGDIGLAGSAGSHGYDFIYNDDDPTPPSTYTASHGTHCAGIIAASTNNAEGVASSAWHTKVMALRTSNAEGYVLMSSILSAYQYLVQAAAADVNVVAANNSWTGPVYSPVLDYMVTQAGKAGIISFFAAGNSSYNTVISDSATTTCTLESPYAVLVASASDRGALATYSNYNETQVDLATPGSLVLSTISTGAASDAFCATLSKQAGKSVEYYDDLSGLASDADAKLSWTLSGQSSTTYETVDLLSSTDSHADTYVTLGKSTETTFGGEYGLGVHVDAKGLETKTGDEYGSYALTLNWEIDNPFKQNTAETDPADWTASLMIGQQSTSSTTVSANAKVAFPSADGQTQFGTAEVQASAYDIYSITQAAQFTDIDTTSEKIRVQVVVRLQDSYFSEDIDDFAYADELTCVLSGLGVGTLDDYVPYALMSGTSMATPAMVGAYAELAALYPDDTALELRGRLVGSTTPLATSKVDAGKHETATDGLFSFDVAINGDVSANTWSAEADASAGTVRLFGYGLGDASVAVDGAAATITDRADDGSWVDVQVSAGVLDGEAHRFDVTDASTGKTHRASYTVSLVKGGETDELSYVCDLPAATAASGNARLVSTPIGLMYASADGQWAYLCEDPDAASPQWRELAACGTPWTTGEEGGVGRTGVMYAYLDGVLYALASDTSSESIDGSNGSWSVYLSKLDLSQGAGAAWTDFECVANMGAPDQSGFLAVSVAVADGAVHLAASYHGTDYDYGSKALIVSISDDGVQERSVDPSSLLEDGTPVVLIGGDSLSLFMLQELEDDDTGQATHKAYLFTLSETDGSWTKKEVSGWSDLELSESSVLFNFPHAVTGSGEAFFGKGLISDATAGDVFVLDPETAAWTTLGTFGLRNSTGLIVQSGAMCDGRLYIVAEDSQSEGSGSSATGTASVLGALYTLPEEAASTLASADVQVAATAEMGGVATVADWRGAGASGLGDATALVRMGDTATWTATPNAGYSFVGWCDADGTLVSTDAVYSQRITRAGGAPALTARFALASDSGSDTPSGGDGSDTVGSDDGTSDSGSISADTASETSRTGDAFSGFVPLLIAVAACAAGGIALALTCRVYSRDE